MEANRNVTRLRRRGGACVRPRFGLRRLVGSLLLPPLDAELASPGTDQRVLRDEAEQRRRQRRVQEHGVAGEGAAEEVSEAMQGRGAELVIDMVGSDDTLALSARIVRFESHLTVVGLAGGTFQFGFGALPFECQLAIPYWGSAVELIEVLDLARAGKIRSHVERFHLEGVEDAYEKMRNGSLDGRAVICPHG